MPDTRTEAEKYHDHIMETRRSEGRRKYGRGLTHTDGYDWNRMALEESMDLGQYLAAECIRLHEYLQRVLSATEPCDVEAACSFVRTQLKSTLNVNKIAQHALDPSTMLSNPPTFKLKHHRDCKNLECDQTCMVGSDP